MPLVSNGGIDPARAEVPLAEHLCDAVAFGRLFISNPDLPQRVASAAALAKWNPDTFYQGRRGGLHRPSAAGLSRSRRGVGKLYIGRLRDIGAARRLYAEVRKRWRAYRLLAIRRRHGGRAATITRLDGDIMNRTLCKCICAFGLAVSALAGAPAHAGPYAALYLFGDSLSDTGNNALAFDAMGAGLGLPPGTLRTPRR